MTCQHCGHLACPHPDPVYAGIAPAVLNDRASNRETDGLRGHVQGVAVHDGRYATDPAAGSCGKADDISGEARA